MLTFVKGRGLLNGLINKLPFELHLPKYNYCGPGTHLAERLERGDIGINKLDEACKEHDIAYSTSTNLADRHQADKVLEDKAWERVRSSDAKFGEKAAALLVTGAMKGKRKLGMGIRKPSFKNSVIIPVSKYLKKSHRQGREENIHKLSIAALRAAKLAIKKAGGRKNIRVPRIIPFESKSGSALPLIPILAGLSAVGSLLGGASAVAKTVIDTRNAKKQMEETKRHNAAMEAVGKGLYLKKSKCGYGLYLAKGKKKKTSPQ